MIVALLTLASGVMFYLSQGLNDWWPLAWVAPTPLLWLAYGKGPYWQLVLAGAAACFAGNIYAFQCYSSLPPVLLLEVIVPQVVLFSTAVACARAVERRMGPIATLLAFPSLWAAFEYLISLASPHGSYGSFAYSQVSAPALIQCVSLLGLESVTFLLCLFANALAMALRARRQSFIPIGFGFAACALNVVFGVVRLTEPDTATSTVAAIVDEHGTGSTAHQDRVAGAIAISDTYARAVRAAAAQGASIAVLPEGGILVPDARSRSTVLEPLVTAAAGGRIRVIAGVYERSPPEDVAYSIAPDGTFATYAKRHLVPILEAQFTPGRASGWLGDGRAVEICKDMDFPRTVRRDAERGIRLMAVPAGDFGKDGWLHARMAVMRGVENGFAIVRAANDGWLTASDAEGRLLAAREVAPAGLTAIVARLPLGPGPTLYTRIGDVFSWFCVGLSVAILANSFVRTRSRAGKTQQCAAHTVGEAPLASEQRTARSRRT
ncbi:MAG: nitrilase-related carbon-nitrogen hydrolase [Steroidobacteraceae bacterium]